MKYLSHALVLAFLLAGCDANESPVATITGMDVALSAPDHFIEIQDVAGRTYTRVESFPAVLELHLWNAERSYFVIEIEQTPQGLDAVAVSHAFRASELTGSTFTTSGDVQATFTLD